MDRLETALSGFGILRVSKVRIKLVRIITFLNGYFGFPPQSVQEIHTIFGLIGCFLDNVVWKLGLNNFPLPLQNICI